MEELRTQLDVLSKSQSMEILNNLLEGPKYISQISREMNLPFTTVHQRVTDLERAGFVEVISQVDEVSKRPVKKVRLVNFRMAVSPSTIHQLMIGKAGFKVK